MFRQDEPVKHAHARDFDQILNGSTFGLGLVLLCFLAAKQVLEALQAIHRIRFNDLHRACAGINEVAVAEDAFPFGLRNQPVTAAHLRLHFEPIERRALLHGNTAGKRHHLDRLRGIGQLHAMLLAKDEQLRQSGQGFVREGQQI